MDSLAFLLKSYGGDVAYAERLIDSFHRFNTDQLTLHCVVPDEDLSLFAPLAGGTVRLHAEESLLGQHLVDTPTGGLRVGYANQEIVKMAFSETGLASNYFCIDSEAVFLRPFGFADFMRDSTTPYSVLVEDNDLKADPNYFASHWLGREASIRRIMAEVGLEDPIMRTCHGHQVFSAAVLESFVTEFLQPRQWAYRNAIDFSPYEFSWYAMWLQKAAVIPIHQREPLVKVFHTEQQHLMSIAEGITDSDLARGYVAVVVNSNFSKDRGLVPAVGDKPRLLAPYLSYSELAKLGFVKARNSFSWKFSN